MTSRFCVVMKCRCLAAKLRGRRLNLVWLAALGLTLGLLRAAAATLPANLPDLGELENSFRNPPATARPWVYGFWVDGNVSREGITADLEAMQRVGIGGILLMDVTQNMPKGPVRFNSDSWHQLFQHLVAEAARLGLQVDMHNAPGWSGSGGPWVTPEFAMQQLVIAKRMYPVPGTLLSSCRAYPKSKATHVMSSPWLFQRL